MTPTEFEHAEQRMKQKWHDLVMAEQQGVSVQTLERLYNSYMLAVEEYNRGKAEDQRRSLEAQTPMPIKPTKTMASDTARKKKAS